jgi:hypothetical protein
MTNRDPSPGKVHGARWATLVRVLFSLSVLVLLGYWGLFALALAVLRCDENCSGSEAESWIYPGQAVVAAVGIVAALVAIGLGFGTRGTAYRIALGAAVGSALVWAYWITSGGF